MKPNYASTRDLTGTSYESSIVLMVNDPERRKLSEKELKKSKNEAMDLIVEIDRIIASGVLTAKQVKRRERKRAILLGRIAYVELGETA
jgi:hypothetical protein